MVMVMLMRDIYALEIVYVAIFMLGMTAAILLGRWTTKRLLIFIFIVATLLTLAKAGQEIVNRAIRLYPVPVCMTI